MGVDIDPVLVAAGFRILCGGPVLRSRHQLPAKLLELVGDPLNGPDR